MSFPKHIAIRPGKPLLTGILTALSLAMPALAAAQSPIHPPSNPANEMIKEIAEQSVPIVTDTAATAFSILDPIILIYLVPLAMILSVLGWMLARRHPQPPSLSSSAPTLLEIHVPPQLIAQPPLPRTTKTKKSPPPLPHSTTASAERFDSTTESNITPSTTSNTTTEATFSIHPAASRRQCPRCNQFFDAHLNTCQNDACALTSVQSNATTTNTTQDSHDALQRTQCTQCGRRYEDGTRYCYVDGMLLTNDTHDDAKHAAAIKVCRICGQEADIDQEHCPHDNTELTLINPSNLNRLTPAIPLLICSKCRQYAMPGTAFCPNDGELLTPLLNAKFAALPANGFGPRRKLCRKCGTRYSDACPFCSQDGTPLAPISDCERALPTRSRQIRRVFVCFFIDNRKVEN